MGVLGKNLWNIFQHGRLNNVLHDLESLALLVGCLSHDLDHRGTNNQFQIKWVTVLPDWMQIWCWNQCALNGVTINEICQHWFLMFLCKHFDFVGDKKTAMFCRTMSPLAQLYSTSTMERHHFDHCLMIVNTKVTAL